MQWHFHFNTCKINGLTSVYFVYNHLFDLIYLCTGIYFININKLKALKSSINDSSSEKNQKRAPRESN